MSDVIDFRIDAIRRCMADLNYERKELNRRMNGNRQKMAECRNTLRKLEEERRKGLEREHQDHAVHEPAPTVG